MNKGSPELATKYWKKIGELEKQLGKAIRRLNKLEEENHQFKKEVIELKIENAYLKEKLFGKNKKKDDDSDDDSFTSLREGKPKKEPRKANSYRRPEPKNEEIAEAKEYEVEGCDTCDGELTDLQILERFIEDIPAFFEIIGKIIRKELIHSGFCKNCNKRSYGKETNLQGQKVTLGPNVKLLAVYLVNVLNMSFQNTVDLVFDLYHLQLSKGELRNILYEASKRFEKEHFRIRDQIRGKPAVHMDETGWRKLGQKWFGWIFAPTDGEEVSFEITNSRGKGVAENIVGKDYDGVIISDFYRLYKNLGSANQSCWVHLIRDFENLAKNKNIPKNLKNHTYHRYAQICKLYSELKEELVNPFDVEQRKRFHRSFQRKLLKFAVLSKRDQQLKKLKNLKLRIQNYQDELLTCLLHEGVPPQNNKAEQKIRHLVIKRKISFGSKSEKGARALAINISVLLTHWKTNRGQFFSKLQQLMTA